MDSLLIDVESVHAEVYRTVGSGGVASNGADVQHLSGSAVIPWLRRKRWARYVHPPGRAIRAYG